MRTHITEELVESTYLFCIKRVSDSESAKDLAQDILCEAIKAEREGREFVSFYSWYWKMARNKYADLIRHRQSRCLPIETAFGIAADLPLPVEDLVAREDMAALRFALSRLSHAYREIIVRFYLHGEPVKDIAASLGIPEGTVKRRLSDGRKKLREGFDNMKNIGISAYAPAHVDWFWGYGAMNASLLMSSSKIVPQVMVICRAEPKTVNEIADELGVAPVYLEEYLEKMTENELLISPASGKYLANCCLFPKSAYMEAKLYADNIFHDNGFPERITERLLSLKDKIMSLDFYGNHFDYSYLMWLLYTQAGGCFGAAGAESYMKKYNGKQKADKRKYRLTMEYILPGESYDGSVNKQLRRLDYSCLTQEFKTSDHGRVTFHNEYEMPPFPNDISDAGDWRKGRDLWVDGNNISLLISLSKDPGKKLTEHEEEMAAGFIKNGLLKKEKVGLAVQLPIFRHSVKKEICTLVQKETADLAAEYANAVGEGVEKILLPYVRRDQMSNFICWDMHSIFQVTGELFWYGWDKHLKMPEDFDRSAAGLYIMTDLAE